MKRNNLVLSFGLTTLISITSIQCWAAESLIEWSIVYAVVKPKAISTVVGVNHGVATQVKEIGTQVKAGDTLIEVMEKETTRFYRSTMVGVISKVHVTEGAVISPGMPLVTVLDPQKKQIEISFSPKEAQNLKVGSLVQKQNGQNFGSLEKISGLVDPDTGAVVAIAKPTGDIKETIGDIIPVQVQLQEHKDCEEITEVSKLSSLKDDQRIMAISGTKVCIKRLPARAGPHK